VLDIECVEHSAGAVAIWQEVSWACSFGAWPACCVVDMAALPPPA
jgi:hypothetical protein